MTTALTASLPRSTLAARSRQGSSVVEQGTHKPLVGSSTLPPGTALLWRGLTSSRVPRGGITSALRQILRRGLLSTNGVIRTPPSALERSFTLQPARNLQRSKKLGTWSEC